MRPRNQTDLVSGAVVLALGVAVLWLARDLTVGSLTRMGTGYFPTMIGWLFVVIGVALVGFGLAATENVPLPRIRWRPVLAILGSVAGFMLGMAYAGLVGAIVATIAVAALADPASSWRSTGLVAALTALAAWALFVKGLGLAMPVLQGTL